MDDLTLWDGIKLYYKYKFDIPDHVIELYSQYEVLKKCVQGYSNLRISQYSGIKISLVRDSIRLIFGFEGWELDLDFSPIAVYNRCNDSFELYRQDVLMVSSITTDLVIRLSYMVCKRFKVIEKEIEENVK